MVSRSVIAVSVVARRDWTGAVLKTCRDENPVPLRRKERVLIGNTASSARAVELQDSWAVSTLATVSEFNVRRNVSGNAVV